MYNLKKYSKKDGMTKEMVDFFEKRTNKHIELVKQFCKKINNLNDSKFNGILERGKNHDKDKFDKDKYEPYVFLTWDYKCKDEGKEFTIPDAMKEKVNKTWTGHASNNRHHPESHSNKKDKMIDATNMEDLDIAEMVSDWCAMSKEKKDNPKDWADKNVDVKWKFNDDQKKLIYNLINKIWN